MIVNLHVKSCFQHSVLFFAGFNQLFKIPFGFFQYIFNIFFQLFKPGDDGFRLIGQLQGFFLVSG